MSLCRGRKENLWAAYYELSLHVPLFWKEANKFLKDIKNGMVSNTENVFSIVTDTSCFRLVSYQRKHTAKIDRLSEDR